MHCDIQYIGNINDVKIKIILVTVKLVGWLVGSVLWHINICRLFTAKSIFM